MLLMRATCLGTYVLISSLALQKNPYILERAVIHTFLILFLPQNRLRLICHTYGRVMYSMLDLTLNSPVSYISLSCS